MCANTTVFPAVAALAASLSCWVESIADALPIARKAIAAINILSKDVGIPEGLVALGKKYGKNVREEDIPAMTANAQKDACGLTNPRTMTDAAVAAIYKAAL